MKIKRNSQQKLIYYTNPLFFQKCLSDLEDTEEKVAWILKQHPRTRDSDIFLIFDFWHYSESHTVFILPLSQDIPPMITPAESITRCRRKLSEWARKNINEHPELNYLLPMDPDTELAREIKEKAVREYAISR